jgi:hypothetical protein
MKIVNQLKLLSMQNRKSFLKSLMALAAAPKIAAQLNIEKAANQSILNNITELTYGGRTYVVDLELLKPEMYHRLVKQYTNK